MVSGFLVRYDGSMVSIDSIVWIELAPDMAEEEKFNVVIHMNRGYRVLWTKTSVGEVMAVRILQELADRLRVAIEP